MICLLVREYLLIFTLIKGHYAFFFSLTEQLWSYWNGYMTSFGLNGGHWKLY